MMRFPTPHCWHPLYAGETGNLLLYQFSPTKFRWGQYKKGKLFSYYLSPSNYIFRNGLFYKLRQRLFPTRLNGSIGSHFPAGWPRRRFGRRSPAGPISASPATYLMSTEQTPVFFAAPKYPAMLSKLAKGRTESYGDSARGPTWQSHEQRFPAALQ